MPRSHRSLTLVRVTSDHSPPQAPYVRAAGELRSALRAGQWAPGQQLPARKDLAAAFRVAPMTLDKALRILQEEGYVSVEHGRGTYVRDPLPSDDSRPAANYETITQRIDELCETIEDLNRRMQRLETQGPPPGRKADGSARSQGRAAPKR